MQKFIVAKWKRVKSVQWRKLWSVQALEIAILTCATFIAYQATRQTNAVIEIMRLERRAWLGITTPQIAALEVGKDIDWSFIVQNSGASPGAVRFFATHVFTAPDLPTSSRLASEYLKLVDSDPEIQSGVVPPTGTIKYPKTTRLSQDQLNGIAAKSRWLYAIGILRYTDGLSYEDEVSPLRSTQFCLAYNVAEKEFQLCPSNNFMD